MHFQWKYTAIEFTHISVCVFIKLSSVKFIAKWLKSPWATALHHRHSTLALILIIDSINIIESTGTWTCSNDIRTQRCCLHTLISTKVLNNKNNKNKIITIITMISAMTAVCQLSIDMLLLLLLLSHKIFIIEQRHKEQRRKNKIRGKLQE